MMVDLPHRVQEAIRRDFPVLPVPSVPEIRLHRAGPKSGLWRLAEWDAAFSTPYWAHLWGGGIALARYVLDHPDSVAGKRVLDLGTGSGLVAIAARKAGASAVLASDNDRYALAAALLNAEINGEEIATIEGDLTSGPPPAVDIVLIGDLFYEQALADRVTIFMDRCLADNIEILVGDPGRAFLPRGRLQMLEEYAGTDFGYDGATNSSRNSVFAFRRDL